MKHETISPKHMGKITAINNERTVGLQKKSRTSASGDRSGYNTPEANGQNDSL